ncbi:extensin-3-like [Momordica charantia]|uniref:Extensin-3-like n=1 Tax=Momordica charantia TaxID=3673 RepID=A0A6J1CL44_MOMCH|nr:extensin-3-like [Momordica charantia]
MVSAIAMPPFVLFFLMALVSPVLPSKFAALQYIHPSPPSLSPSPLSTGRPIVPYYPFIFPPPPPKKPYQQTSPPLPPPSLQGRPIVPYYPFRFPPPPIYHAFPHDSTPSQKTYYRFKSSPPPPPKRPYQWP